MKLSFAAFTFALATTTEVVSFSLSSSTTTTTIKPTTPKNNNNGRQTNKITRMRSSSALMMSTTMEPSTSPERIAPDAGYVPEWENRPGLAPEEYMASDMSKPDLSGMWECPLTLWDAAGYVFFVYDVTCAHPF